MPAFASSIGAGLQKTLTKLEFLASVPRWPQGKKVAACVSHDVDYPEVVRWLEPLRLIHRKGLRGLAAAASVVKERRNHWHFLVMGSDGAELEHAIRFLLRGQAGIAFRICCRHS